jgi:transcriptional regulator with XRE-family HTH domain
MKLFAWRAAREMSQGALADATGLAISSVSRIERGTHWPSAESILRIWKATNGEVTAQDIFDGYVETMVKTKRDDDDGKAPKPAGKKTTPTSDAVPTEGAA